MNDVCLVLEGSYPYATGGVSAWVQSLMEAMPDTSFSVAHLRERGTAPGRGAYRPPRNMGRLVTLELDCEGDLPAALPEALPEARIYHSLSTGPAGILGTRAAALRGRPAIVTEHGLAWLEARLGITGCKPYIESEGRSGDRPAPQRAAERRVARLRRAAAVESMARAAYALADAVTTVCRSNAQRQLALGAPPDRMRVIENAVPATRAPAPSAGREQEAKEATLIGLVGRVVPVKDVRTFIRACAHVREALPQAEFVVVGPTSHDPAYVTRCRELAVSLGLAESLTFTGASDPGAWYPRLDAVVLTSVSEAQPLALLEAMSAGVPVVTTAVGGCPELVEGGRAGMLTPVADPMATAAAIVAVLTRQGLARGVRRAARERVERRHSPARMSRAYADLYHSLAG